MKLIIAIIQDEDASEVISHLNEAKFQVTRLSTKGGFLRAGNTTIMTGVEDEKVEGALKISGGKQQGAYPVCDTALLLRCDAWADSGTH